MQVAAEVAGDNILYPYLLTPIDCISNYDEAN